MTAFNLSNDSVGDNWQAAYSYDGREIFSGQQWIVPVNVTKTVTINATVTEKDKWPDVGAGSLSVILRDNFETSTTVTVTENKGRYNGRQAQWEIFCRVRLVKETGDS